MELGARSIDHLEATGPEGVAELAASDVVAVMLPVAALYLARPMPRGRALADAGAAIALATDFNPGSAFCESLPVVWTLACTQLGLAPEEALGASTVNAAHVLGLHDRGRIAVGLRADLVLIDAPDWRHVAYHLAGDARPFGRPGGPGRVPAGIIEAMASQKQRRKRAKEKRHAYDLVEIDAEGNETVLSASELKTEAPAKPTTKAATRSGSKGRSPRGTPQPPNWSRVLKRGALFAPIFLATVMLLGRGRLTVEGAIVQTVFLLAIFIPFSYFMDRLVWRSHEKRLQKAKPAGR